MFGGLLLAGTAVAAGAVVGAGALGLGLVAAHKVGSAYGQTVEQMYEQQRLNDYYNQQQAYNQQAYYQQTGRSHHQHYHQPSGYHRYGYSNNYRQ